MSKTGKSRLSRLLPKFLRGGDKNRKAEGGIDSKSPYCFVYFLDDSDHQMPIKIKSSRAVMSGASSEFQVKVLTSICQGLHSLYTDRVLCDFKVTVGHKTFDCHLLLLASVSGFFQSLASSSSSWQENRMGKVTIEHEDVTQESFQMLLDILYKSEDVITIDTATDVLRMSIFLQVKFLEQYCTEYLITNITPEVCVGIWMFAEKYQLPDLANKSSAMASDQIDQVVKCSEILHLPKAMLLVILGSQRKLSYDDICRTILSWVEEDADSRQVYFEELLPFVSFPQLSPVYINELMNYFDHPFFKYINKYIRKAVSFNLQDQKPELKRQLLAQQVRVTESSIIRKCAVIVGGCDANGTIIKDMCAFYAEPGNKFYYFKLNAVPKSFKVQSAICLWRNELYISQGFKRKTFLAKYVPGNNEWEVLPELEFGVEGHSMSAVNSRIYLVGGSSQCHQGISCYDISTKTWTKKNGELQVDVEDAATAVLGHRIYVFGGKDGLKKPVDTVQCLDTTSGQVYVAGLLPTLPEEIRALSDGGVIYLLCDGKCVLRMKEHFDIADRKERHLKVKHKASEGTCREDILPIAGADNSPSTPSVSFVDVGTFADERVLSAFLQNGEMVACGIMSSDGTVSANVQSMNLVTGEVAKKRLAYSKPLKNFALHTLNIPQEFLNEEQATGHFQQGDRVKLRSYNSFVSYSLSGSTGTVQSVDGSGNVTVSFPNHGNRNAKFSFPSHGNHNVPPSHLYFA